jgi:predicted GNAT family acetyltransferase
MYQKDHISLPLENFELKLPNWFLREKGALNRDVFLKDDILSIPKLKSTLKIRCIDQEKNVIQIGNYTYRFTGKQIELQNILTNPFYWLGNIELTNFTGAGIFQWYRKSEAESDIVVLDSIKPVELKTGLSQKLSEIIEAKEISLLGLHYAAILFQSELKEDNDLSILFFNEILSDTKSNHYKLAIEIVFRPFVINNIYTRRKIFLSAFQTLRKENFRRLLDLYLQTNFDFLNKDLIADIDNLSRGDENLSEIEFIAEKQIKSFTAKSNLTRTSIPSLFELLVNYGVHHPLSYYRIRRFFLHFELYGSVKEIRNLAKKSRLEIRSQFMNWLGAVQRVAIDPETGEEYRWNDVLIFDQAISEIDQKALKKAISEKQIIREAIFLFFGGTLISLNNILPSGVWISKYSDSDDRSVFRATIQTRFQGGFDISIHLNHKVQPEILEEELKWKVIAGTEINGAKLAARFGGYWEEYNLWTEEFINEETVEKFIRREYKKKDETAIEKLRNLWKFFVWNAAAAYVKFWELSEMKMELTDTTPDGIVVSPHDYQTGCIIASFSKRRKTESTLGFIMNFFESFVKQTEEKYPEIKKASVWNAIFSGIIEAVGIENGGHLINKFRRELSNSDVLKKDDIITRIDSFLRNLKNHGYLPKQLYFSVKRFHRWFQLNHNASLAAQSEMLYELYETYRLFDLEEQYPAARTRFFLETVFYNSSQRFKDVLRELVKKQRHRKISKEDSLQLISSLHFEFELDEKENYFITRLGYPHLKPSDSAALLKIKSEIAAQPNLVVQRQDDDGNMYTIRKPVNPKEISKLHQLYLEANLTVNFRPEHQFLVAVSERGFIIGGIFYYRSDEETVHMEKIVVSNRYRRKGISEGLMNELFSRLKSDNTKFITTGFFRPEYFYQFGFKIERKYSGLVKELY